MEKTVHYDILDKKIAQLEAKLSLFKALEDDTKINYVLFKTLFDIIPAPLFYKDTDGIYRHCNDAFSETIIGIAKDKILGRSLYDFSNEIPKKMADIYRQKDTEILKKIDQQSYEAKVKCADGVERYYHFYKSPLVVNNKTLGILGMMLDVSEYKRTLKELDKVNAAFDDSNITSWLPALDKIKEKQFS